MKTDEELLADALRAICFTRDYVLPRVDLPAIDGWTWYDVGCEIAARIPDNKWAKEFHARCQETNQESKKE